MDDDSVFGCFVFLVMVWFVLAGALAAGIVGVVLWAIYRAVVALT